MYFDHIKFKRDRKRLMTAEELAERCGMSLATIQNIDIGRRKTTTEREFRLMCDAAGLNFDDYVIEAPPSDRPVVITILTNKGGAGKTTLAVNLAGSLSKYFNKKCLVIDTDLQQNTTMHLGMLYPLNDSPEELQRIEDITKESRDKNIYNCFVNKDDIHKYIFNTPWENLDIVMSCDAMSTINKEMFSMQLGELRMKNILKNLVTMNPNGYDFVIIDCNPDLSQINESALFASDYVIIPLEATAFGLRGVQYVIDFYKSVKEQSENLELLGVMLNKYDGRKNITKDISEALRGNDFIESKLFETKIPVDTSIEQAQGYGEPLFANFSRSKACKAYKELAEEILIRLNKGAI